MTYEQGAGYWTDEYALKKAEALGCVVEFADDHTLQIDIDSDERYDMFWSQLDLLDSLNLFIHDEPIVRKSKTRGHTHITIRMYEPLPIRVRLLLQSVLGSDLKRELLSYAGVLKGQLHPVLLFRPTPQEEPQQCAPSSI